MQVLRLPQLGWLMTGWVAVCPLLFFKSVLDCLAPKPGLVFVLI